MGTAPPAQGFWRPAIVMNHREMIRLAGEALYGERWQSELSRAVGVSDRTMRRWVSDPYEIPGGVWNDIQQLLLARGVAIEKLRNEIIRAIPDAPQSMKDDRPMMPTVNDRQIFSELPFNDGKLYTAGNVDRRKYDRLTDLGWVEGVSTNISDVEYHLTVAGHLELALIKEAADMASDFPDPAPNGFQTVVNAGPRRRQYLQLKVRKRFKLGHHSLTVDAIEGDVVTVKTSDGDTYTLNVPPSLILRS
jgi:hypothetical protein